MNRKLGLVILILACLAMTASIVMAQNMPWEKPLQDISTSVIGPVALAGFLIALAFFALMWMLGWGGIGVAVGIVIGGAILGNAETIATWLGLGS